MSPVSLPLWADLLASVLLVLAAGFALVGAWGLARLDDFFKRLHGPSKASTLGVGCSLLASALVFACAGRASWHELLITVFVFVTAPVAAQLLIQAALKEQPSLHPDGPPAAGKESPPPAGSAAPTPPG
jgi:multicomponent K+:H+ antiporter subunit G